MDEKEFNLILDLDGTLIDISDRHYAVYRYVVNQFKGNPLSKSDYWKMKRGNVDLGIIIKKSSLPQNISTSFLIKFKAFIEKPAYIKLDRIFPYSLQVLKQLLERCDLFLISLRKVRNNCMAELKEMGLFPLFKRIEILTSDTDSLTLKTAAIKKLKVHGKTIVIGDTEVDILSAKKLNLLSVTVLSGIRGRKELKRYMPDYMIQDISYLSQVLELV